MTTETQHPRAAAVPSSGALAEGRQASRAGSTYATFLTRLRAKGFASAAEAERAVVAVLCALEHRLGSDQSFKLESQLPSILAELLAARPQQWLRPRDIGKQEFSELVNQYLDDVAVDAETAARRRSRPASLPRERAPDIVDDISALSLSAQLGVLRTIAPKILARLGAEERSGFLRDLDAEISLALSGMPTYDVRHGRDA